MEGLSLRYGKIGTSLFCETPPMTSPPPLLAPNGPGLARVVGRAPRSLPRPLHGGPLPAPRLPSSAAPALIVPLVLWPPELSPDPIREGLASSTLPQHLVCMSGGLVTGHLCEQPPRRPLHAPRHAPYPALHVW